MLFDRVKGRNSNDNTTRPFGFRYEPNGVMGNDYNFKGPGAWRNLTIDAAYNWTEAFTKQSLGYVTSGASTILVHSLLSESGDKIYVASLNEGTKTLTAAGAWALVSANDTLAHSVTNLLLVSSWRYCLFILLFFSLTK